MIEKIVTSKIRIKLLTLFLSNMDDRYYLRELERKLDESLSPLRRQLLQLEKMGILVTEEEVNVKYYKLNKNFEGVDELRNLVLGKDEGAGIKTHHASTVGPQIQQETVTVLDSAKYPSSMVEKDSWPRSNNKRIKYDIAVLTLVSIFVLATSMFVVYASTKNIMTVAEFISEKTSQAHAVSMKKATATTPDEMVSRRWKIKAGGMPALSGGYSIGEEEKRSEEL